MEKQNAIDKLTKLKERLYGKYDIDGKRESMGIIPWIKENPGVTDPNMYEIVSCWCEYGEALRELNEYYSVNGYPTLENGEESCHYTVWQTCEEGVLCRNGLVEMENLRDLSHHDFFQSDVVKDFFTELKCRVLASEYDIPENSTVAAVKKELLCKSMGIPFYIWQTQKKEPNYKYDNICEWNSLLDFYQMYKDSVGIQHRRMEPNGNVYEGPQFGYQIENALALVEKSYAYNDEPKKLAKK